MILLESLIFYAVTQDLNYYFSIRFESNSYF